VRSFRARSARPSLGILLLPAATILVHQLRYWIAYGARANSELAAQGHSYLHSLVPWTMLALGLCGTACLRRLARALRTGNAGTRPRLSLLALWTTTWAALVLAYATQETLEALFATGHPSGLSGILGHGGWWAVPAAGVVAAAVALLLRIAGAVLRLAAAGNDRRLAPVVRQFAGRALYFAATSNPLARAAAGRAPPVSLPPW
jgi:hypothetical protein